MVLAVAYIVVLTCDLHPRHRALRPGPERDDHRPGRGAAALRRRRARARSGAATRPAGDRPRRGRGSRPFAIDDRSALDRGAPARRLHLLGLGERRQPHARRRRTAASSPGSAALVEHGDPARHLRRRSAIAVVAFAGARPLAEFDDDEGIFGVLGARRARLALGQARRARDRHLRRRLDADDDHPGLADDALDGRAQARSRRSSRAIHPRFRTPHVSTAVIACLAIAWYVPRERDLRELPLRLALALCADDRVLLRPHRDRVHRLLPARADEVGLELPLHRRRAGRRCADPRLPLRRGDASLADPASPTPAVDPRVGDAARDRLRLPAPRADPDGRLAAGGGHERFFGRRPFEAVDPAVASGAVHVAEEPT